MSNNTLGFFTYATITVLIIFIVLIIIYFWYIKILLPEVKGAYALVAAKKGNPLYLCGNDQAQVCNFDATTLSQAVNICNSNLQICKAFSYNGSVISFIDPQFLYDDPNNNTYLYQYLQ